MTHKLRIEMDRGDGWELRSEGEVPNDAWWWQLRSKCAVCTADRLNFNSVSHTADFSTAIRLQARAV